MSTVIHLSRPSDDNGDVMFERIGFGGVVTDVQNNRTDTTDTVTMDWGLNCVNEPVIRAGDYEFNRAQAQQMLQALLDAVSGFDRCRFSSVVGA